MKGQRRPSPPRLPPLSTSSSSRTAIVFVGDGGVPFVELRRPPLRPNRVTYVMPCRGLGLLFNGRWTIESRHRLLWRQHRDGRKKILCGGNVPGEKLVENKEEKKSRKERHTCLGAYPCIRSGKKAPSRLFPFVFYSIHFFLYLFFFSSSDIRGALGH